MHLDRQLEALALLSSVQGKLVALALDNQATSALNGSSKLNIEAIVSFQELEWVTTASIDDFV